MAGHSDGDDPDSGRKGSAWVRTQEDLGRLLRQLRRREARRRGGRELTYRELADKTGWSHASIGQYFTGGILPPTDRFDALVRLLGAAPAEQGALASARDRIEDLRRGARAAACDGPASTPPRRDHDTGLAAAQTLDEPPPVIPRQLPLAARHFTGRQAELTTLSELADHAAEASRAVIIVVIDGTAGIGKTALAVHAAHRIADRFPDGQLYINLRGFDLAVSPVEPSEAIRGFLDAFAVPAGRIPAGFEAQASLYRSILAGRRMLVVLDNARDARQLRPLLPGTPGCMVIATSRNQLTGLILAEHAQPLTLGLLPAAEAYELLAGRLGAERLSAEREAAREIIASCAGLPLALSIFAARAAAQPYFPLALLAAEMLGPRRPAESRPPDPDTDIRVVFSWSCRCLPDHAARVFRLIGIHPGPDIDVPTAAALTDAGAAATQEAFGELAAAHLLTEHAPGRFTCHDLLRDYARELAHGLDGERGCRAALHRMYAYYLHTSFAAAMQLNPVRHPITLEPPPHGISPGRFTSYHQALGWFSDEHQALLASIDLAYLDQQDRCAWQLAWTIADYLDRRGHWHDWVATQRTAVDAAQRIADKPGQAHAHSGIGRACDRLGQYDDAHEHLQRALRLYLDLGDRAGEAQMQLNLAGLCERQGWYAQSLAHAQRALPLFQDADSQAGRANALNVIGWCQARLGDYPQALAFCRRALVVHQQIGDRLGAANTLDSLGYAHHHLGDYQAANAAYRDALQLYRYLGDRYYEAVVLTHIGDNEHAAGDAQTARGVWLQALSILDPLDRAETDQVATRYDCPDAALVRAKLRESGVASPEVRHGSGRDQRDAD